MPPTKTAKTPKRLAFSNNGATVTKDFLKKNNAVSCYEDLACNVCLECRLKEVSDDCINNFPGTFFLYQNLSRPLVSRNLKYDSNQTRV